MAFLWKFLEADNDPLRSEARKIQTKLFTLLEGHCKNINDLVNAIHDKEGKFLFHTIIIEHEDDWDTYKKTVTSLLDDIKLYLRIHFSDDVVALLDVSELYQFSAEDIPVGKTMADRLSSMWVNVSPMGLIPGYVEKYRLENMIKDMREKVEELEPIFFTVNKDIMKVIVYVEMDD